MAGVATTAERRRDPRALWPQARSVVVLGMNYGPADDPLKLLEMRTRGGISVYARGRDYHDVVKSRLKQLAGFIHQRFAAEVKRSEEHTSELQSLMRISYAVFCLKKKKKQNIYHRTHDNHHPPTKN